MWTINSFVAWANHSAISPFVSVLKIHKRVSSVAAQINKYKQTPFLGNLVCLVTSWVGWFFRVKPLRHHNSDKTGYLYTVAIAPDTVHPSLLRLHPSWSRRMTEAWFVHVLCLDVPFPMHLAHSTLHAARQGSDDSRLPTPWPRPSQHEWGKQMYYRLAKGQLMN